MLVKCLPRLTRRTPILPLRLGLSDVITAGLKSRQKKSATQRFFRVTEMPKLFMKTKEESRFGSLVMASM